MTTPSPTKKLTPAWKQGLKAATVLAAFGICGALINLSDRPEAVARAVVNIPLGFLVWWMIFTALVWGWRKIRGSA